MQYRWVSGFLKASSKGTAGISLWTKIWGSGQWQCIHFHSMTWRKDSSNHPSLNPLAGNLASMAWCTKEWENWFRPKSYCLYLIPSGKDREERNLVMCLRNTNLYSVLTVSPQFDDHCRTTNMCKVFHYPITFACLFFRGCFLGKYF